MSGKAILARRAPRRAQRQGIEEYLHRDIEVRTLNGGSFRGHLEAVDAEFLHLTRSVGRGAKIPRAAVVAVLDEERYPVAPGARGTGSGGA